MYEKISECFFSLWWTNERNEIKILISSLWWMNEWKNNKFRDASMAACLLRWMNVVCCVCWDERIINSFFFLGFSSWRWRTQGKKHILWSFYAMCDVTNGTLIILTDEIYLANREKSEGLKRMFY